MTGTQYVDKGRLEDAIAESGLRIGYIADQLGISLQGFRLKRNGKVPFRKLEIDALSNFLRSKMGKERQPLNLAR